jgi:hypothetical protein
VQFEFVTIQLKTLTVSRFTVFKGGEEYDGLTAWSRISQNVVPQPQLLPERGAH